MWMLTLRMVRFRRGVVLLHCVIGLGIVRVVVDLLARIVLLMINLRALLLSELTAVGRTVTAHANRSVVQRGTAMSRRGRPSA